MEVLKDQEKKKYNYTKKTGRPSKYDPKYCDQLLEYFSPEPEKGLRFPSALGFCKEIGINRDTFTEWCNVHPEFSVAYSESKELLKNFLNSMCLLWYYNWVYWKFVAINMTDMVDKKEVDTRHSWSITTANIELSEEQKKIIAQQILWSQSI